MKMEHYGIRFYESPNRQITGYETIFDKIPGSSFSNSGFIKFGPDEKLYVGTGAGSDSSHLLKLILCQVKF